MVVILLAKWDYLLYLARMVFYHLKIFLEVQLCHHLQLEQFWLVLVEIVVMVVELVKG